MYATEMDEYSHFLIQKYFEEPIQSFVDFKITETRELKEGEDPETPEDCLQEVLPKFYGLVQILDAFSQTALEVANGMPESPRKHGMLTMFKVMCEEVTQEFKSMEVENGTTEPNP